MLFIVKGGLISEVIDKKGAWAENLKKVVYCKGWEIQTFC